MASLDLSYVDELIWARKLVHGGGRGAPPLLNSGSRQGASINRSCIVLLSAQIQGFIEEVFEICAKSALPSVKADSVWKEYWKQLDRWGNPSPRNINGLFLRIGIKDVLDGLSWKKCSNSTVINRLDHLNQIRNDIAHGDELKVNGSKYSLSLSAASQFRNFAEAFGTRFEKHALSKL